MESREPASGKTKAGLRDLGDRFLEGGIPAMISGAGPAESARVIVPLTLFLLGAAGIAEAAFGSYLAGLAVAVGLAVVAGLLWRAWRRE
jgi:hypothetical protein